MKTRYIGSKITFSLTAFIIILLLSVTGSLASTEYSKLDTLDMNVKISSDLILQNTASNYDAKYLKVNLSYYPRSSDFQTVTPISIEPKQFSQKDEIVFNLENPALGEYAVSLNYDVQARNRFTKIKNKVSFPIDHSDLPKEVKQYTLSGELIDSHDDKIALQASEIVQGEDDLMIATYKLASWVRENINYSLSSATISASKSSSWVLENRYGVCDEITTLFISFSRSLGIPARFVSGVAWTNYQNTNDWGPHAWAEVYFPGYGWVPFDITYSQFGFVDASHVALKKSLDAGESSITYEWKGRYIEVKNSQLDIETTELAMGKKLEPLVNLNVNPIKKEIGFGSYNLIELEIENKEPFYIISTIQIAQTIELDLLEEYTHLILLKPNEKKKIYWIVKLTDRLKEDYLYTIPLYVASQRNATSESVFNSQSNAPTYSLKEMADLMKSIDLPESRDLSANLKLNCTPRKEFFFEYEKPEIICKVKNTGLVTLTDLKVCENSETTCQKVTVPINVEKELVFQPEFDAAGQKDLVITASNSLIKKNTRAEVTFYDKPQIQIIAIDMPNEIKYRDSFLIEAKVKKNSFSNPQNLTIHFRQDQRLLSELFAPQLSQDHTFQLEMLGEHLADELNTITLDITYMDNNNRTYNVSASKEIKLIELNFAQKSLMFFNKVDNSLLNLMAHIKAKTNSLFS